MKSLRKIHGAKTAAMVSALSACFWAGSASAFRLDTGPDWTVNLDNSVQYTLGWRAKSMDHNIGNHLFFQQGDYKFPKRGDIVTNRIQDLIEFQGINRGRRGFRISASVWNDFAYNDVAKTNPKLSMFNTYPSGHYSDWTKRFHQRGGELLDAFVFDNFNVGGTPVYAKLGRLSEYWGNAFFFGFSNIGYSQQPLDYIKGFSQPGSEVKELFLPRAQILLTAAINPELSITGQYFFENRPNRYPEGGTYLGAFDILWNGPTGAGATGLPGNEGYKKPDHNAGDFGVKASWSPEWAQGDIGFYYRELTETDPWAAMVDPKTGNLYSVFASNVKLFGLSYEHTFGLVSTGFELNQRRGTALNTAALARSPEGARGNITNFIANALVQLNQNALWDAGTFIAEMSYTHLDKLTSNSNLYNGVGTANCVNPITGGPGSWKDGCSTDNSLAIALQVTPQWLQVFPGIDLSLPISYQRGVTGNPAYRASGFFAQASTIASVGLTATYKENTSVTLQYNAYDFRTGPVADNGLGVGMRAYAGFGGNGPVALNDKDWLMLRVKSSF